MMRLFALTTLIVSPPAYMLLKGAAYMRHDLVKRRIEKDDRPLEDTWHQHALDWVYPI
jgi:hypothetical protein